MSILSQLSCPSSPDLPIMFCSCCPPCHVKVDLSRLICQVDLSTLTCPRCPVLDVHSWLSCHGCPSAFVLCWLSCPSCPCPVIAILSWLSCHSCPVLADLFQQSCPVFSNRLVVSSQPWRSCHRWPVATVLPSWPVPSVLSELLSPSFLICDVLSIQSCFDCPVHLSGPSCLTLDASLSCLFCHVLGVGFSLSVQPNLFRLTLFFRPPCPGWHVPAVFSWLSCPSCSMLAVLPQLSCPGCLVSALSLLTCSGHPLISVFSRLTWSGSLLANLSRLIWPGCPVQVILSPVMTWLSCP